MSIKVSKKDIYWSFFTQFFSITSGIITLPMILRMLSVNEIGMNYLILSVGSLITLFDFGFSAQFGRNISYIFGGAQKLQKEGFDSDSYKNNKGLNYKLLAIMIKTTRYVFARLAFVILVFMLTLGTLYIYKVTDGFSGIKNSALIWVIYCFSVFLSVYYSYYTSLLIGKGMIKESQKAIVYSRILQVFLTFLFLFFGMGLLGVVISNFISPILGRYLSYKYFFTDEMISAISNQKIERVDVLDQFSIVWYNAKKLGIASMGSYATSKCGIFLAGMFLSLDKIASYGLMIQLFGVVISVSMVFTTVYQPRFSFLRLSNDKETLLKEFILSVWVFYIIFISGAIGILLFGTDILALIGSHTGLPTLEIMIVYSIVMLLELNHLIFAGFITTGNKIPFIPATLTSGFFIILGTMLVLKFTSLQLLGIIIVQGVVQLCYNNWKWPLVVFEDFNINLKKYIHIGFNEIYKKYLIIKYDRQK
ncbi:O-unit flippase-like protein [Flavobacterium sp. C3NV]|uniref:O-unit flippase-like protein n=1 Tax=Flavobacterium sp. C3NV TaxID=3393358 RepID=UPI00398FF295